MSLGDRRSSGSLCAALSIVLWPAFSAAADAGAGPRAEQAKAEPVMAAVRIEAGRTTTVEAGPLVGAPIERAVKSEAYAQAVAADGDQRWAKAAGLYQQAVADWTSEHRHSSSPLIEHAIYKADRERQRSQLLAGLQAQRDKRSPRGNRGLALERARLLRGKLMLVRAFTGAVPRDLYVQTRRELQDALDQADAAKPPVETEVRLLLCATRAAGGDRAAARLELAHVTTAQRDEPNSTLPLAVCHAALGDLPRALDYLEASVLRQPIEQRIEPFALRDLYLANDWDRLRGDRRFENLFTGLRAY